MEIDLDSKEILAPLSEPRAASGRDPATATTFVERVSTWAALQPSRPAVTYEAGGSSQTSSYGELDRDARSLAAVLAGRGLCGERVLLACPLGLDFVRGFFACLHAGAVAVPVPFGRAKSMRTRLAAVVRDAEPRAVLTSGGADGTPALLDTSMDVLAGLPNIRVTGAEAQDAPSFSRSARAGELAFLQYTSGSTSEPKGTAITHGNILANQRMLAEVFATSAETVVVSWLPLFHDMGLIGMLLHGLYLGGRVVLLPTLAVLKDPLVWLRAIERFGGTFSAAPNFAYDSCVDKTTPAEREGLDLRSWATAVNGSEPVRHATVARFQRAFASSGLRASSLTPAYGLAEATLVVSGSVGRSPSFLSVSAAALAADRVVVAPEGPSARWLVGCGRCDLGDQKLRIVHPAELTPCGEDEIGEIWITGSHVAAGYFRNPAATTERFEANLPGEECTYLRTGDLGFVRGGELFVTGRIKEVLIVRGQKFYPQDLEGSAADASPHVRRGHAVAFAVEGDAEPRIVVVAEVERRELATPELAARVALEIQTLHDVPLSHVQIVGKGTVPKTTSGKLQRGRCRQDYLEGRTSVVAEWRPPGAAREPGPALEQQVEAHARQWLAVRLGLDPAAIDVLAPFVLLGLDSIVRVELMLAVERRFAVGVPDAVAHGLDSIRDLARFVAAPDRAQAAPPPASTAKTPSSGGTEDAVVLPDFSSLRWDGKR
ncbi:MAG TPA: AMP-binding protein [Polyangiaceae bacterium]